MTHDRPVTRRAALAAGTAALGAVLTHTAPAADENLSWIDAHSHIWPPEVDKFPLAPGQTKKDLDPPSFTDDELMALAKRPSAAVWMARVRARKDALQNQGNHIQGNHIQGNQVQGKGQNQAASANPDSEPPSAPRASEARVEQRSTG